MSAKGSTEALPMTLLEREKLTEARDSKAATPLVLAAQSIVHPDEQVREHSSAVERCGPHVAISVL